MATMRNRKEDHYAKTQNVRDEGGAPQHLESAGDLLIKTLAKKQVSTVITLREQLELRQEFEKGPEIKPLVQTGLSSLSNFRNQIEGENESRTIPEAKDDEPSGNATGLSRHELELGLVEKPGSQINMLYKFALGSRRGKIEKDDLASRFKDHPLNRLKEIHEEMLKKSKRKNKGNRESEASLVDDEEVEEEKRKKKKGKKKRKRKRPGKRIRQVEIEKVEETNEMNVKVMKKKEESISWRMPSLRDENTMKMDEGEVTSHRPSLWDVKDMKELCATNEIACKTKNLYTIKGGKIVQAEIHPRDFS